MRHPQTLEALADRVGWSVWDLRVGGRYAPHGHFLLTEPLPEEIRRQRDSLIAQEQPR
jgi:hypothetical protein